MQENIRKFYFYSIFDQLIILGPILTIFFFSKGLSFTEIMFLGTIQGLFVALLEVPTGAVADMYSRKTSLIIGCLLWITSLTIYIYAQNYFFFLIGEILFAIGMTFKSGADSAIIYDTLKTLGREGEFQTVMGKCKSNMFYASALGCILAGFVYEINIYLPFVFSILFIGISMLIAMTFKEPPVDNDVEKPVFDKTVSEKPNYMDLIRNSFTYMKGNRKVMRVVLFSTVTMIFFRNAYPFYQPYMIEVGIPVKFFGIIFFAFNMVAGFSAKRADLFVRFTKPRTMLILGLLTAVSFIGMGLIHFWIGFALIFLQQVTRGLRAPIFQKHINKNIPSSYRATIISFVSFIGNLGFAILAPFLGILFDTMDVFNALLITGLIMGVLLMAVEVYIQHFEVAIFEN